FPVPREQILDTAGPDALLGGLVLLPDDHQRQLERLLAFQLDDGVAALVIRGIRRRAFILEPDRAMDLVVTLYFPGVLEELVVGVKAVRGPCRLLTGTKGHGEVDRDV